MTSTINGYPVTPLPSGALPLDLSGTTENSFFTATADQKHALGRSVTLHDGSVFRYIKNGATQLAAALLVQSEAVNANVIDQVQTGYTTAIGDTVVYVLVTTSNGISDNELVDGRLVVNKGTGLGYSYRIKSNEWYTGDTVMKVTLYDSIRVATAATSEMTLVKNPYMDAIVAPTTLTGTLLGVPNNVIPASYYGWVQTKGLCPILVDTGTTLVVGEAAAYKSAGTTVAGAVDIQAATDPIVGRVVTIGTADEAALIDLRLE